MVQIPVDSFQAVSQSETTNSVDCSGVGISFSRHSPILISTHIWRVGEWLSAPLSAWCFLAQSQWNKVSSWSLVFNKNTQQPNVYREWLYECARLFDVSIIVFVWYQCLAYLSDGVYVVFRSCGSHFVTSKYLWGETTLAVCDNTLFRKYIVHSGLFTLL
jgi:hypothetical protein